MLFKINCSILIIAFSSIALGQEINSSSKPNGYDSLMVSTPKDRFVLLEDQLDQLSYEVPGLNEKVELSVNGVSVQEFLRGIATSNNLNVNVDPTLNIKIVNNFSNVSTKDVFLFLCKRYDLDISFIGTIMSFFPYSTPKIVQAYVPKAIKLSYNKEKLLLSLDLNNDSLFLVAKEITKLTGKNITLSPEIKNQLVSGFIQELPLKQVLEKLSFANDFKVNVGDDESFLLEKRGKNEDVKISSSSKGRSKTGNAGLNVKINKEGLISVDASGIPLAEILDEVSAELKNDYFLFTELTGKTSLNVTNATYEEFLKYLLNGTEFTFKKEGGIYLIGDRNLEGLRATKVVQLKYRTIDKIVDFIPADLKKGVDIKIFPELNSLIISGSQPRSNEIELFLKDIDRVVPVILIEVLIMDIRDNIAVSAGIQAGLGKVPTTTSGVILGPTDNKGLNINMGANSINKLISGINGFSSFNLGKVTSNFYLNIKALETQGYLKIRSTPKLATLNGHEAKLTIGETRYYLEQQSTIIGSQIPSVTSQQQYKSINADLTVTINPIVSGDEQITLDISVIQNSFGTQINESAPFGLIKRDFKSMVRVKNEEMIILGGLEENSLNDAGSGLPFLSRIPVIKWMFGNRTRTRTKSKLTVFIKPTVIY